MTQPTAPPPIPKSRSLSRWWWLVPPLAIVAALAATPYGGWLQSFFIGSGVRWQDAYVALDTAEVHLPRNPTERERLLLLNAHADGDPPLGLPLGPRLHPVGTLARLRYETFDETGQRIDQWEVRALVPNIGNGTGPFWREGCHRSCQEELARAQGMSIVRSGAPGIAEEWVLRMPVGRSFELRPTPLRTQDLLDARERSVGISSVRVGQQSIPRPARMVVTLVDACVAQVRVGTTLNLEVYPNATIPIPSGFVTSRWAQLDGCGKLAPFPPPPEPPRVYIKHEIVDPPDLRSIVARRDPATGHANLYVDEAWLAQHHEPVTVHVLNVCRYDAEAGRWQRLAPPRDRISWRLVPQSPAQIRLGDRVAFEIPREVALYWLSWSEQHDANHSSQNVRWNAAMVVSGPVLCNDVDLGTAPEGRVAACVPFANRAEARFVPAPEKACRS